MSLNWSGLVADPLFAAFGVAATYTPAGGSAVSVTVIPGRPDRITDVGRTGVVQETPTATVRAAEVAQPGHGDRIAFSGVTYAVLQARADLYRLTFELDLEVAG